MAGLVGRGLVPVMKAGTGPYAVVGQVVSALSERLAAQDAALAEAYARLRAYEKQARRVDKRLRRNNRQLEAIAYPAVGPAPRRGVAQLKVGGWLGPPGGAPGPLVRADTGPQMSFAGRLGGSDGEAL